MPKKRNESVASSGSIKMILFKENETKRTVVYKQADNAVPDDQNPHRFYVNKPLFPNGDYPANLSLEVTW